MSTAAFRDLLGTDLPIIQAPMAGAQGSDMAIAVSNAGGLGSQPCALLSPEAMRSELERMQAGTIRPYNVNFFAHRQPVFDAAKEEAWRGLLRRYYMELGLEEPAVRREGEREPFGAAQLEVLSLFRPRVVSFHFGLPEPALLEGVRALGAKVLSSATTVEEAMWLEQQGVDGIIAQGLEAGGHRGHFLSHDLTVQMGTFALLPQIVNAVRVPVIAAGGIVNAQGVKAALDLGAVAVQSGTAYLLCPESRISPKHRQVLTGPEARHTALTTLFTGRPARSILNRMMRDLGPLPPSVPEFPLAGNAVAPLRAEGARLGLSDFSPLWAGQNASACRSVSAAEVTLALAAGAVLD
jgi:nitronate monooxygenase